MDELLKRIDELQWEKEHLYGLLEMRRDEADKLRGDRDALKKAGDRLLVAVNYQFSVGNMGMVPLMGHCQTFGKALRRVDEAEQAQEA